MKVYNTALADNPQVALPCPPPQPIRQHAEQLNRNRRYADVLRKQSTLSQRAQALDLFTRADVEAEYELAREGWSTGTEYHCPFCNLDFDNRHNAWRHMQAQGHPVLRMDWYD